MDTAEDQHQPNEIAPEKLPEPAPTPAETPAVPATTTVQCPSCEATLQKVTVTPGVKIHCLHCGARFLPAGVPAEGHPARDGTIFPDPAQPKTREPKSPGYWLLRAPAAVALTAGIFITALIVWNEATARNSGLLEYCMMASYVPLIALSGVFAFLWSRSLARIDAGMTQQFWKCGLLREALPPMPGSSLPYIGPFAIVGGFFPVFMFAFGDANEGQLMGGALIGAILFLAGFMAEDIRQFAWRQYIAAEMIAPPNRGDRNKPYGASLYSRTAIACLIGFGALAFLEFYIVAKTWHELNGYYYGYSAREDLLVYVGMGLVSLAAAITGFMLCCDIDRAAASWLRVATHYLQKTDAVVRTPLQPRIRGLSVVARFVPIAWLMYGLVWLFCAALIQRQYGFRDQEIWCLISISLAGLAIWFSRMMQQIAAWRWAKQSVHAALRSEGPAPAAPQTTGWPGLIVRLTVMLTLIEVCLMSTEILYEGTRWSNWKLLFAIPLILGPTHYVTLFVAAATREFLGLEQYLAKQTSTEEE